MGSKSKTKNRNFNRDYQYAYFGYVAVQDKRDSTIKHFDWLNEEVSLGTINPTYGHLLIMIMKIMEQKKYLMVNILLGHFSILIKVINFLIIGAEILFILAAYHENIMHHSHKTQSLIYDYRGKEEYIGNYIMTDLNIGSKLNVIYGVREEKNTTTYKAFVGLEGPLPHFNASTSDSLVTSIRKNSYTLPALFLKYDIFDWFSIRYAKTKTLTRPNYTDILPFYHISGASRTVQYSNPFLTPGVSNNEDIVLTLIMIS